MDIADCFHRMLSALVRSPAKRRTSLNLELLEGRVVPIVGQYAALNGAGAVNAGEFLGAPQVRPHEGYDGVVRVEPRAGADQATASLFSLNDGQSWGHHLLSAAHVFTGVEERVTFEMFRYTAVFVPGQAPPITAVPIEIPIRAGNEYQVQHPDGHDIAVVRLADPRAVGSPSRLLIPPAGAQRYSLYSAASEIQQQITVVGYGRSGDGEGGVAGRFGLNDLRKRQGINRLDVVTNDLVQFDFDGSLATVAHAVPGNPNDTLGGPDYGIPGIAVGTWVPGPPGAANVQTVDVKPLDIGPAQGDSGAPYFLAGTIAGIHSQSSINARTWGNIGTGVRVSTHRGDFINPVAISGRNYAGGVPVDPPDSAYDVVLDMSYQVYGAGVPNETVLIHALNVGGFLEIHVTGPDAQRDTQHRYNGLYYRAPAANIRSLTIRGTSDNETILIQGPLGLRHEGSIHPEGTVYVDGGAGNDVVVLHDSASPDIVSGYTLAAPDQAVYDAVWHHNGQAQGEQMGPRTPVYMVNAEHYKLYTGIGADTVRILHTPVAATFVGTEIITSAGSDTVTIGSDAPGIGMANVRGLVFADLGTGDLDALVFDNSTSLSLIHI